MPRTRIRTINALPIENMGSGDKCVGQRQGVVVRASLLQLAKDIPSLHTLLCLCSKNL